MSTRETTNPVLWTLVVLVFLGLVGGFMAYWFNQGALLGRTKTKPAPPPPAESTDHEALIAGLDSMSMAAGKQIYEGNCISCHGPDGNAGVNGARKFPQEALKNGSDPYSMYDTLKNGYNLMPAQGALSAEEKYQVIHYIRETFFKEQNPDQYIAVDEDYLASAPWPAAGAADGGGTHPYGANATKPLEVPVLAVMAHMVEEAKASHPATDTVSDEPTPAPADGHGHDH